MFRVYLFISGSMFVLLVEGLFIQSAIGKVRELHKRL